MLLFWVMGRWIQLEGGVREGRQSDWPIEYRYYAPAFISIPAPEGPCFWDVQEEVPSGQECEI